MFKFKLSNKQYYILYLNIQKNYLGDSTYSGSRLS